MTSTHRGTLVGATFGLVFVLANAGALPLAAAIVLWSVAIAAFVVILRFVALSSARPTDTPRVDARGFGRRYRVPGLVLFATSIRSARVVERSA